MKEYREQLEKKMEELKQEFNKTKDNLSKNLSDATPNKIISYTSTYAGQISDLSIVAGKINALQEQLRVFDYYNKEN